MNVKPDTQPIPGVYAVGGAAMIAIERERQISSEGWTPEHDDEHDTAELVSAARCYDTFAQRQIRGRAPSRSEIAFGYSWPWPLADFKPSDDPVRNLVKAGALIAAEIDRLLRS